MDASLFILLPTGDEVIGLPLTEEGLRDLVAPLMRSEEIRTSERYQFAHFLR